MRKALAIVLTIGFTLFMEVNIALAVEESFVGHSEYTLDKSDSINDGEKIVYREALRNIVQQAGIRLQSKSVAIDNIQNNDVIEALATAVVKVTDKKITRNTEVQGEIKIIGDIKANIDVDLADNMLNELVKARETAKSHNQSMKEYQKKSGQYNELHAKYIEIVKNNASQKVREGIEQEQIGRSEDAMLIYNNLIAEYDEFAMAYSRRGNLYHLQGRDDLALQDYNKALSLDEQDAYGHYGKAVLNDKNGKKDDAVKEYRLFLKYANILDDNSEIIKALERVVALAPEYQ